MAEKLLMLALSPTMESGMLTKWLKSEGDRVASGDVLCEVETDKAVMDYESPADGILLKIILEAGESASIGDLIGIIGREGEDISGLLSEKTVKSDASAKPEKAGAVDGEVPEMPAVVEPEATAIKASPLARTLASQHNLKLEDIKGSGPDGRIVKADIERTLSGAAAQAQPARPSSASGSKLAARPEDVIVPVSGKRRIIAQRLSESMYSAPHYYLKVPVEIDQILSARQLLNARRDKKVSLNAFLIKFVAEALKRHPQVNATWTGDSIIRHGRCDIGLAVALEDGLITPVVRDCWNKGILQIDEELNGLIQKAQDQALTPEEYSDATFTISNLGSYGIEEFTAIINPPGSAILAVGEIRKEAVVQSDDTTVIKPVMKLTLSCDHRVIDGAVGALFLADLRNMIQEPVRVLF